MKDPLVEAKGLFRMYPEGDQLRPVLEDVTFKVTEGSFTAIMGQSGSGKSTLLHVLSGLDLPTSGTARLAGRDLSSLTDEERTVLRREMVGFVFQFFNLVPNLTVAENIALPLHLLRVKKPLQDSRFTETIEYFGVGLHLYF